MLTLTTITYKLDERFRLEFTNDWEGKYYHLQIINGDLTPLCYIPPASSGSVLCISGIPNGYSSRIYELLVKNTYWVGKIYLLDAPKWLMNKIEEVKACNEDFGLSFAIEKHNANNIQNTTPNLSKYIPEDNAVLFLSEEGVLQNREKTYPREHCYMHGDILQYLTVGSHSCKKITIFLTHGTQSELQKAEEVAKHLWKNFGIKPDVFALYWFGSEYQENGFEIKYLCKDFGILSNINKIITTNSTGILKPEDSTERLQVIDAKKILEEYLKETI